MFHLVNEFGNVHKMVQSEAKKNEMLKDGWTLIGERVVEDVAPYNGPQQADEPVSAPDDPSIMHTTEPEQPVAPAEPDGETEGTTEPEQPVAVSAEPEKKPKGKSNKDKKE